MPAVRCSTGCKLGFLVVFILALRLFTMHRDTISTILTESQPNRNLSEQKILDTYFVPSQDLDIDENAETNVEVTGEMEEIINSLREQIKRETAGYQLPSHKSIEELIPEEGGTPVRNLVITSWRSGSTFTGDILNSHPATFYLYEPLAVFKTVQVRGEPQASTAVRLLRSLFTCRYNVLGKYLVRSKEVTWMFPHNTRLWQHCPLHKEICWLPQFLTPVCKLFPFITIKLTHIRLRLVEELLADPKLNVRVLLLVRDPRGVLNSRSTLPWCLKSPDCNDPVRVCADMVDDYSAALRFSKLFPHKFKVIRYEEVSLYPEKILPDVFQFFGMTYHNSVHRFVHTHTTKVDHDAYSTFRNSSSTATFWRKSSEPARVQELQNICRVAMTSFGYLPAHNYSHQLTFNPLLEPFTFP